MEQEPLSPGLFEIPVGGSSSPPECFTEAEQLISSSGCQAVGGCWTQGDAVGSPLSEVHVMSGAHATSPMMVEGEPATSDKDSDAGLPAVDEVKAEVQRAADRDKAGNVHHEADEDKAGDVRHAADEDKADDVRRAADEVKAGDARQAADEEQTEAMEVEWGAFPMRRAPSLKPARSPQKDVARAPPGDPSSTPQEDNSTLLRSDEDPLRELAVARARGRGGKRRRRRAVVYSYWVLPTIREELPEELLACARSPSTTDPVPRDLVRVEADPGTAPPASRSGPSNGSFLCFGDRQEEQSLVLQRIPERPTASCTGQVVAVLPLAAQEDGYGCSQRQTLTALPGPLGAGAEEKGGGAMMTPVKNKSDMPVIQTTNQSPAAASGWPLLAAEVTKGLKSKGLLSPILQRKLEKLARSKSGKSGHPLQELNRNTLNGKEQQEEQQQGMGICFPRKATRKGFEASMWLQQQRALLEQASNGELASPEKAIVACRLGSIETTTTEEDELENGTGDALLLYQEKLVSGFGCILPCIKGPRFKVISPAMSRRSLGKPRAAVEMPKKGVRGPL